MGHDAAAMEADWPSMLLFQVNEVRRQHDVPPVTWSAQLATAAQAHAVDLQTCGVLSHTGCDGSDLVTRLQRAGYRYRRAAENLALCSCDAARVVTLWMKSDGHRRNLLNLNIDEIGAFAAQDEKGWSMWVLVIGLR